MESSFHSIQQVNQLTPASSPLVEQGQPTRGATSVFLMCTQPGSREEGHVFHLWVSFGHLSQTFFFQQYILYTLYNLKGNITHQT